ncbi:MAG: hypothetical protein ACHQQR_03190 [Gemmatimonadales bacterium]
MLGLGVASSPRVEAASVAAATQAAATVHANHAASSLTTAVGKPNPTGKGWGAALTCAGCVVGAGFILAGGPGAIIVAVNTPGSAIALLSCVAACYEVTR